MDCGFKSIQPGSKFVDRLQSFRDTWKVPLGNRHTVNAVDFGNIHLKMVSKLKESVIYKVLYVSQLTCNPFSIGAVTSKGNVIRFGPSWCWIRDSSDRLCIEWAHCKLYKLDCVAAQSEMARTSCDCSRAQREWHWLLAYSIGTGKEAMWNI